MADNELELALELGTGVLPGGRFSAKLRRTWTTRSTEFRNQVVERAGLAAEQIETQCCEDERLGDLFALAAERAVRTSDGFYRAALGAAVSAALNETASIDRYEQLVDQLLGLDSTCLRVLIDGYRPQVVHEMRPSETLWSGQVSFERQVSQLGWHLKDLAVVLARLSGCGLIAQAWDVETELPPESGDFAQSQLTLSYDRTAWGRWAYDVCLQHVEAHQGATAEGAGTA